MLTLRKIGIFKVADAENRNSISRVGSFFGTRDSMSRQVNASFIDGLLNGAFGPNHEHSGGVVDLRVSERFDNDLGSDSRRIA